MRSPFRVSCRGSSMLTSTRTPSASNVCTFASTSSTTRRIALVDDLFFPTTAFSPEAIKNGLSLEIGTGYGRFVDVVQRAGGRIVGVDLSTHSIDLAQDFTGFRENVFLVQADLFRLPFERKSFQHVFSIGVLHHTPDTQKAFAAIAPYAAPGGQVSISVYHPSDKVSADRWRVITSRMNHGLLVRLLRGQPGPLFVDPRPSWRVPVQCDHSGGHAASGPALLDARARRLRQPVADLRPRP